MADWEKSVRHQIDLICDDCERELQAGKPLCWADIASRARVQGLSDPDCEQLRIELAKLSKDYPEISIEGLELGTPDDSPNAPAILDATIDAATNQITKQLDNNAPGSQFETLDSGHGPKGDAFDR